MLLLQCFQNTPTKYPKLISLLFTRVCKNVFQHYCTCVHENIFTTPHLVPLVTSLLSETKKVQSCLAHTLTVVVISNSYQEQGSSSNSGKSVPHVVAVFSSSLLPTSFCLSTFFQQHQPHQPTSTTIISQGCQEMFRFSSLKNGATEQPLSGYFLNRTI